MKLCDRCKVSDCGLNYLGKACKQARRRDCPEVQLTNAEVITNMDYEYLNMFLIAVSEGMLRSKIIRHWLQENYNEKEFYADINRIYDILNSHSCDTCFFKGVNCQVSPELDTMDKDKELGYIGCLRYAPERGE